MESFPIQYAVQRFDYLLCTGRHSFRIFTDHKNLVFLYDPESSNVMLRRHSLDKIHRWRLHLDGKSYCIECISGTDNVWADLGTRWAFAGRPSLGSSINRVVLAANRISAGIVRPLQNPDFV